MSASITTGKFYIPSLDGIRAVAVMIVFFSHAGFGKVIPGGLGVTVFFFLSGFLITTLLRQEHEKTGVINLKHFYLRRVIRIWPNFYFVLFIGTGLTLTHVIPGSVQSYAFLAQLFHITNYYSIYVEWSKVAGTGVFWSLAVEEHFYLLFPMLYIFLLRVKTHYIKFLILIMLCLTVLLWRIYLVHYLHVEESRIFYASDTRFDSLLFGCALAVFQNPVLDKVDIRQEYLYKYIFLPLGIGLLILTLLIRNDVFRDTYRYTLQGISLIPIFITAISFPKWGPFVLLNLKYVRFMGVLSYSFSLLSGRLNDQRAQALF